MAGKHLLLVVVVLLTEAIPKSTVTADQGFHVNCDFGNTTNTNYSSTTIGELTSHFGNARSCKVSHQLRGIIRVFLSRQSHNISSMFVAVLEEQHVTFVGTVNYQDIMLGTGYHFHACPTLIEDSKAPDLQLLTFGTPENATFKLDVTLDNDSLDAHRGDTKSIEVQKNGLAQVISFDIQEKDLFKLLQISAESDDDMLASLIVSQSCAEVQAQGVGMTSHKKEKQKIHLTFTRYGRITLSQYSLPKIQAGRWYIGVVSKNISIGSIEVKKVNISVMQTFSYDTLGKGLPVLYMCLITGIIGIIIAIFAHFFLNSDFDQMSPPYYVDENEQVSEVSEDKLSGRKKYPTKSILNLIPEPIHCKTFPFRTWVEVVCVRWFGRGMKTYSYLTVLIAISFLVGSAQFVIGRWSNMITTGDRDKCYYNERCYRPIAFADLPSNFMISNVPYCLHGVFLALAFSFREAICLNHRRTSADMQTSNTHAVPYDFSLAYALSWALLFEGLFSATYHLCPSRLTFQFDSAFMFIISGLVVVALFNARIGKIKSSANDAKPPDETIVQAPKYFLFFVAPLLVLNYVGSIRDTSGLPSFVEGLYWVGLVIWLLVLYVWTIRKVGVGCCSGDSMSEKFGCSTWEARIKWFWLILVPICLFIIGMKKLEDWSQFFLFSCVAAVVLTIAGLMSLSLVASFRRINNSYQKLHDGESICDVKSWCWYFLKNLHRIIFTIVLFLFWVFAMYFFKLKPTAKKVALPSISRTHNDECVLWDFFDYHDIWHMLSSIALYMSAFLLIYITRSVEKQYWVEAIYWNHLSQNDGAFHPNNRSRDDVDGIRLEERPSTPVETTTKSEGKVAAGTENSHAVPRPKSRTESLV